MSEPTLAPSEPSVAGDSFSDSLEVSISPTVDKSSAWQAPASADECGAAPAARPGRPRGRKRKAEGEAEPQPPQRARREPPAKPAPTPPPKPKAAKAPAKRTAKPKTERPLLPAVDEDETVTDKCCDTALWRPGALPIPKPLPTHLNVLETFAGAGGLHMSGNAQLGDRAVTIETLFAIEIEEDPSNTYRLNHPETTVLNIGVSRFLATARRLHALKEGPALKEPPPALEVVDVRIAADKALALRARRARAATSTTDKQDQDGVTPGEVTGTKSIPWLEWKVCPKGSTQAAKWEADCPELAPAAQRYLRSKTFGPNKFPLPGDIHVVTGGPPCQGWSGYNTQRPVGECVEELMRHPENRLIGRFMEVCWFYKPLYVLMEEVPDVSSKTNVMEFIQNAYESKGYCCSLEKRLRTGMYGCPQTRDRMIFLASLKQLPAPAIPKPIHSHLEDRRYPEDEDDLKRAFRDSYAAYPISVWSGRTNHDEEPMRPLVIGDSLSCDLPTNPEEFGMHAGNRAKEAQDASTHFATYLCDPPTPYIAYLRQGCKDTVRNHVCYALGATDILRCQHVPYSPGASWREMGGFQATLKRPMMMVLDEPSWVQMRSRWIRKIPDFMRKSVSQKEEEDETQIPPLQHGWKVEPRRFPLVPYWCVTMKKGSDSGCYGRLTYAEPHPTVHSYHKPHWHPSLVPFAPRVMTVREKARIQGFSDSFVFTGTVEKQYKQIANAVSPQLAKFLTRAILLAHLTALHRKADPAAVVWSESLQTFRDFMVTFSEASLPKRSRHTPAHVKPCPLTPMTYEEFIMEYNTEFRTDHSVRNCDRTPFEAVEHCEEQHEWHVSEVLAMRWKQGASEAKKNGYFLELLVRYEGFTVPEWVEFCAAQRKLLAWKDFYAVHRDAVDRLQKQPVAFGQPGFGVADAKYESYLRLENGAGKLKGNGFDCPELVAAQAQFEAWKKRYEKEKKKGWIKATNSRRKYNRDPTD